MHLLKLIRWNNLLVILLTEVLIKYGLMDYFFFAGGLSYRMSNSLFIVLALSSIAIAAGGNIINDIEDISIDKSNGLDKRPLVSGKMRMQIARRYMYAFNTIGILLSFGAAFMIQKVSLAAMQLMIMALLYGYSVSFKRIKVFGNIVVALCTAMVPALIWLYTVYDVLAQDLMFNYHLRWMHLSIAFFVVFAFLSNLIRELIKDKEDAEADLENHCRTWAAEVNIKWFKTVVFGLMLVLIAAVMLYQHSLPGLIMYRASLLIVHIFVLFFAVPRLFKAKNKNDFHNLSMTMKTIMLVGLLSPIFLWFR